jgi:hypothetical protein
MGGTEAMTDPSSNDRTEAEQASVERAGRAAAEIMKAIRAHDPSGYRKDSIPGYPVELIPDP